MDGSAGFNFTGGPAITDKAKRGPERFFCAAEGGILTAISPVNGSGRFQVDLSADFMYTVIEVIIMTVNTDATVSISEAVQDFSRVARLADEKGAVVIMQNNAPRYWLIDIRRAEGVETASDEDVLSVSSQLIKRNRTAYEVLAK